MNHLSISMVNAFCRKFDLVFVEMGQENTEEVLHFLDYRHARRIFTSNEIIEKLSDTPFIIKMKTEV